MNACSITKLAWSFLCADLYSDLQWGHFLVSCFTGEALQGGNVKSSYVLSDQQAIVLQAVNQFKDTMFKG